VSLYAREIARLTGLNGRSAERVGVAALLHDVGKIHEEFAAILRKPGRLSDAEFARMKLHPVRSADLVSRVSHFSDIVSAVRGHHEAWNGCGYPDQLKGASIPIAARIIAVADTIDAMTTTRPYRAGLSLEEVKAEILREGGRQFDPVICERILSAVSWASLERVVLDAHQTYPANESPVEGEPMLRGSGGLSSLLAI
jgi:HD-GYP domain-containing protein (c-di-GMP phosphodiesterase class II)